MKNNPFVRFAFIASIALAFSGEALAQQTTSKGWSLNPYEQKVFIENQGQFNGKDKLRNSQILFGVDNLGVQMYFTAKGLTYRYDETEVIPGDRKEEVNKAGGEKDEEEREKEEKKRKIITQTHTAHLEWLGANPNAQLLAEEMATEYSSYANEEDPQHQLVTHARSYRKLLYKNLYPNIDVEYIFHKTSGMKYTIILHPGADLTQVKMKWDGDKSVFKAQDGNIHVPTHYGDIVDHAPLSFFEGGDVVRSSFQFEKGVVSFSLDLTASQKSKISNQKLIIDPWTINPGLTIQNKAMDIEKDKAGNVYVFGGKTPYKLKKYDINGNLLWTFNTPYNGWYGDMAVDNPGNAFISEGYNQANSFPNLIKVNPAGVQLFLYSINGCCEFWSLAFNCSYTQLTVAGGLWSGRISNVNTTNGTVTGTTNINPGESRSMTMGPNGRFYSITTTNQLVCVNGAFANVFTVGNGYAFTYNMPLYTNGSTQQGGSNFITVYSNFVYTTNGARLDKWNATTGGNLGGVVLPGGVFGMNGGIFCDACGNIFVGTSNSVLKYDPSLTLLSTTNTANPVYDVSQGTGSEVLACGDNFASSLNISSTNCSVSLTLSKASTGIGCGGGNTGTASVTALGGTGPYTYSWNPGGFTTSSLTGLSAGTYTCLVTDASSCYSDTISVTITSTGGGLNSTMSSVGALCNGGNNGTATITANGGTSPYTYSWTSLGQNTQTATGLSAGTYTVTITDATGCSGTKTVTVTQPTAVTVNQSQVNAGCNATGSASVTGSGGTGAFTYSWNNGQTNQTATALAAGSYTATVTDNNGCSKTTTFTITGGTGPTISGVTPTNVLCNGGTSGIATATGSGGTGALTYSWNNGQNTQGATGLSAGTYTVTVSDNNGCTSTTTVVITEPPVLTVNANGTAACSGSNAQASSTAAGGFGAFTYSWNNGQNTATATGLSTGNYTVTITDANGCTAQATTAVNSQAIPSAVFTGVDTAGCAPLCVTFNNTTANITNWSWNFGDGNNGTGASPKHCYTSPGTYSVTLTVTDNNGCTSTYAKNNWIQVYPQVTAGFSASPQPTTILNPTIQFTDQSLNASSWSWSFGDILNSTSNLQNPTFNYKDSGCYNVQLIADNQYNCADTANELVCIQGDYELFAPNAFTPDGSGLNDVWNVKGIGIDPNNFKMWIFDRWGNLIFETSDLYQGWNGKANGGKEIAQQDVYVWKVATKDFLGNKHNYIGHVSLVR